MENLETYPVICEGGWNSNQNHLLLSQRMPGQAITLVNYEPSLFGGYRKLSGFTPLESEAAEVDAGNAEGKIYTVAFYDNDVIVARKQVGSAVYKFYKWVAANPWDDYTTGLTLTSTNVDKIRWVTYNYDGTEGIAFVDGVNSLALFNGTTWVHATSGDTGADFANAGGNQILAAPKYITHFKNHIFISGDATDPHLVAHSAPEAEYDWTTANGAGQIIAGFEVIQLKAFRDELYVFGTKEIKKIVVENDTFVLKDVTKNIGCLSSDSVIEFGGDILFLSQDGFRTIAATERVGDIEIAIQSKNIQQDITDLIENLANIQSINAVVIKKKSQIRCFFSEENLDVDENVGIIGGIRTGIEASNSGVWEWSKVVGIRTSFCASQYIDSEEYVLHGDYNGKVYRQEVGNDFDGANILAVYTTPYFELGEPFIRKNIHKIIVFVRPEAELSITTSLEFDWGDLDITNPNTYLLEASNSGTTYGTGIWDTSAYASQPAPLLIKNVEGSGFSFSLTFTSDDTGGSYSIQAIVFEYATNGRK